MKAEDLRAAAKIEIEAAIKSQAQRAELAKLLVRCEERDRPGVLALARVTDCKVRRHKQWADVLEEAAAEMDEP